MKESISSKKKKKKNECVTIGSVISLRILKVFLSDKKKEKIVQTSNEEANPLQRFNFLFNFLQILI